jgi:hypothetical protein
MKCRQLLKNIYKSIFLTRIYMCVEILNWVKYEAIH